ncbi:MULTISPECIES: N-formylglutamate amidohydrolase [unclassified Novosphingobium]|uniref:N-formylglutamate amidohydrolase n=1 Tax=unclassified Novosphingobium TaxID=2644732 RepID=UPI00146F4035|nr:MULTISPECIES: N-formylglutamate amidohydrolase [unclassified Novosphingobium]NMN04195.1 putative N-formylglutamate amidohydrolase [Novosphingobium sp. SG919]NMN85813.1 putative N-formylglutamate amidohydrolase [Novosphingobium sp. SG916]
MSQEAWALLGTPTKGGVLIVSDHASAHVPGDIDLGIDPALLTQHMAIDIGVAAIGAMLARRPGIAAFQGGVSRLVCDFNRDADAPAVVPVASDGHAIPGNMLDHAGREARLARFFHPYHAALAQILAAHEPALILSLHSFTPRLSSDPAQARPWHVGVLYNEDDRAARLALPWMEQEPGLCVGDQQPYSGRLLNATMNRHAEVHGRPYLGLELRQDLIGDAAGQAEWAERLARLLPVVVAGLA